MKFCVVITKRLKLQKLDLLSSKFFFTVAHFPRLFLIPSLIPTLIFCVLCPSLSEAKWGRHTVAPTTSAPTTSVPTTSVPTTSAPTTSAAGSGTSCGDLVLGVQDLSARLSQQVQARAQSANLGARLSLPPDIRAKLLAIAKERLFAPGNGVDEAIILGNYRDHYELAHVLEQIDQRGGGDQIKVVIIFSGVPGAIHPLELDPPADLLAKQQSDVSRLLSEAGAKLFKLHHSDVNRSGEHSQAVGLKGLFDPNNGPFKFRLAFRRFEGRAGRSPRHGILPAVDVSYAVDFEVVCNIKTGCLIYVNGAKFIFPYGDIILVQNTGIRTPIPPPQATLELEIVSQIPGLNIGNGITVAAGAHLYYLARAQFSAWKLGEYLHQRRVHQENGPGERGRTRGRGVVVNGDDDGDTGGDSGLYGP